MNEYIIAGISVVSMACINYLWEWLDHHMYDDDVAKKFDVIASDFNRKRANDPLCIASFPKNPFTRYHTGEPGTWKKLWLDGDGWHIVKKIVIINVIIQPTIFGGLLWQNKPVLLTTMLLWAIAGKLVWKLTQKW